MVFSKISTEESTGIRTGVQRVKKFNKVQGYVRGYRGCKKFQSKFIFSTWKVGHHPLTLLHEAVLLSVTEHSSSKWLWT